MTVHAKYKFASLRKKKKTAEAEVTYTEHRLIGFLQAICLAYLFHLHTILWLQKTKFPPELALAID